MQSSIRNQLLILPEHRRSSFEALQAWITDARALASPDLVIVLVGNKLDDEENREVEYLDAARWAKENGMPRPVRPLSRSSSGQI